MYIFFSIVAITLLGILGLAWRLRSNEQSKGLKILAKFLQVSTDVFFIVFFMILAGEVRGTAPNGPRKGVHCFAF